MYPYTSPTRSRWLRPAPKHPGHRLLLAQQLPSGQHAARGTPTRFHPRALTDRGRSGLADTGRHTAHQEVCKQASSRAAMSAGAHLQAAITALNSACRWTLGSCPCSSRPRITIVGGRREQEQAGQAATSVMLHTQPPLLLCPRGYRADARRKKLPQELTNEEALLHLGSRWPGLGGSRLSHLCRSTQAPVVRPLSASWKAAPVLVLGTHLPLSVSSQAVRSGHHHPRMMQSRGINLVSPAPCASFRGIHVKGSVRGHRRWSGRPRADLSAAKDDSISELLAAAGSSRVLR